MALENVDDAVFAEKMVGDGIAIVPTGSGEMLAPADGVVEKIFDTNPDTIIAAGFIKEGYIKPYKGYLSVAIPYTEVSLKPTEEKTQRVEWLDDNWEKAFGVAMDRILHDIDEFRGAKEYCDFVVKNDNSINGSVSVVKDIIDENISGER